VNIRRYPKEEFARRGNEIYERDIRPQVEADNKGKYVAIDIETGAWEMDASEITAGALTRTVRLLRLPSPAAAAPRFRFAAKNDKPSRVRRDGFIPQLALIWWQQAFCRPEANYFLCFVSSGSP